MLPNVTLFDIYHFVTRVMISPATGPLGAPSISKKGKAATPHQRSYPGASTDQPNRALQHRRAQARIVHRSWCTDVTICAYADHSRPLTSHAPPQRKRIRATHTICALVVKWPRFSGKTGIRFYCSPGLKEQKRLQFDGSARNPIITGDIP
jgi:hypothetical protein